MRLVKIVMSELARKNSTEAYLCDSEDIKMMILNVARLLSIPSVCTENVGCFSIGSPQAN